jgi:hypothetical protein
MALNTTITADVSVDELSQYRQDPDVLYAEPSSFATNTPNDPVSTGSGAFTTPAS